MIIRMSRFRIMNPTIERSCLIENSSRYLNLNSYSQCMTSAVLHCVMDLTTTMSSIDEDVQSQPTIISSKPAMKSLS